MITAASGLLVVGVEKPTPAIFCGNNVTHENPGVRVGNPTVNVPTSSPIRVYIYLVQVNHTVKLWPKGRHVILANHVPAYCTAIYITSEPSHLGSLCNLGSVVDLLPFPTVPSPLIGPNTVPCAVFTVFYIIDLLTPTSAIFCGAPGTGASN
jgi:hypothetical protein